MVQFQVNVGVGHLYSKYTWPLLANSPTVSRSAPTASTLSLTRVMYTPKKRFVGGRLGTTQFVPPATRPVIRSLSIRVRVFCRFTNCPP